MKTTRRIIQAGFLTLTLVGVFVVGGNAEAWCPFGGVEAIYTYITEGNLLCSLGVSNFYILGAVLVMTLLVRRAFCGYLCPVGTISEWLQRAAARLGLRSLTVPDEIDRRLALLKFAVLAVILYFTYRSSELVFRGFDPCYALISRHGEDITYWAYVVAGGMVAASLIWSMPFCRWLCPLAAVLTPLACIGLTRIKRSPEACADCGVCARACPMGIPVVKLRQVTTGRCISCLNCVTVCPQNRKREAAVTWGPPGRAGRRWPQAVLVGVVLACVGGAVAATYIAPLPSFVQTRGEPPTQAATAELRLEGLTCRGRATLLLYFLERDDEFALAGYLKLEAWPGPGPADTRITYDPTLTDETALKHAITNPHYDSTSDIWRVPPFTIEGYDPFDLTN